MSHFYGTIKGKAQTAGTRCGSKGSGLRVQAAGWQGAIDVRLSHDEQTDTDTYEIWLIPWSGHGDEAKLIAQGVLDAELPGEFVPFARYGQKP